MNGPPEAQRPARDAARPAEPAAPRRNRALGILRLAVVWGVAGGLAWFGRPGREEWIAGLVFAALGESLRVWAAGYLIKTKELITGGPYAHVRNPLYLGRLLILTGVAVAARMPWHLNLVVLAIGYAVFFLYYIPRKERVEPQRLLELHGEPFREYFEAVPAIFPTPRAYAKRSGSWKWANFGKNEEILMVVSLTVFFLVLYLHLQSPNL
jgi:protein-S-isoprenylcysteine O-methyltransferase Ste14